jgi:hypothetical protein
MLTGARRRFPEGRNPGRRRVAGYTTVTQKSATLLSKKLDERIDDYAPSERVTPPVSPMPSRVWVKWRHREGQPSKSQIACNFQKDGWKTVICPGWGSAFAWSHDSCATVHVQGPSVQILIGRRVLSFLSLSKTSARIDPVKGEYR